MKQRPPQHLCVIAIDKGAFGSLSTKVANFTYFIGYHEFGNAPKVTYEPITRTIRKQLDIKLRQFTQEELDSAQRKI